MTNKCFKKVFKLGTRRIAWALAITLFIAANHTSASAQALQFTLSDPNPTVTAGGTSQFIADLQNTDIRNGISLDSGSFTLNTTAGRLTDNFVNFPLSLNSDGQSGDSATGDLFDLSIAPNAVVGTVLVGSYIIGFTDNGVSATVTQNFAATVGAVSTVPETTSGIYLLLSMASVSAGFIRHRRKIMSTTKIITITR